MKRMALIVFRVDVKIEERQYLADVGIPGILRIGGDIDFFSIRAADRRYGVSEICHKDICDQVGIGCKIGMNEQGKCRDPYGR